MLSCASGIPFQFDIVDKVLKNLEVFLQLVAESAREAGGVREQNLGNRYCKHNLHISDVRVHEDAHVQYFRVAWIESD